MRATIETHENSDHLPPVHVMVSLGDEDVSIKVQIYFYSEFCCIFKVFLLALGLCV